MRKKGGKLSKAGILDFEKGRLAGLIKSKIAASYIYNLAYLHEHNVIKFNLMIEVGRYDGGYPTRLTVSLEYKAEEKTLRVITLHWAMKYNHAINTDSKKRRSFVALLFAAD